MITFLKSIKGYLPVKQWERNCWINVEVPTLEEKNYLITELGIPEAFYNDVEDVDERPRIEIERDWFLVVIRVPFYNAHNAVPYTTIPLGIIFKDEKLVTVCFYKTDMIADFIAYTNRKKINVSDNFDLVFKLLLSSSVWFLKYLKQINSHIKESETKLENSIRNEELQSLLKIEKCLVYFTTSLKGNDILVHKLKNLKIYKEYYNQELIEDVEIEIKQALETTSIYSDILSGMMDAYASVISNNLNVIMKQLTSISIILMIPTLIASLYGMNVPNTFENNKWGFWIVITISFFLSGFGVLFFMKRQWFDIKPVRKGK